MYFLIIVPILVALGLYIVFKNKITYWELSLPTIATIIVIGLFRLIYGTAVSYSTEYRGTTIVKAEYYEYWSTWVSKTCSRTVCSGSGKTRTCHTVYYDCSYCSTHQPYWLAIDNEGYSWYISEKYYKFLQQKWSATPQFVELNRSIKKRGSCGVDGDKYVIRWNNKIETSESAVSTVHYENKIKLNTSAFSYKEMTDEEAQKLGLYAYPQIYNNYKQNALLGLNKLSLPAKEKELLQIKYEYLNGLGYKTHNKTFVLLFPDKPLDIAFQQEQYWCGGNRNELTICIGYDSKTNKLNWVKAFSWTNDRRSVVDTREELMGIGVLDLHRMYPKIYKVVVNYFVPRDFHDFDYLKPDYPTWSYWVAFILALLSSAGIGYWIVVNEFENDLA